MQPTPLIHTHVLSWSPIWGPAGSQQARLTCSCGYAATVVSPGHYTQVVGDHLAEVLGWLARQDPAYHRVLVAQSGSTTTTRCATPGCGWRQEIRRAGDADSAHRRRSTDRHAALDEAATLARHHVAP